MGLQPFLRFVSWREFKDRHGRRLLVVLLCCVRSLLVSFASLCDVHLCRRGMDSIVIRIALCRRYVWCVFSLLRCTRTDFWVGVLLLLAKSS